MLPKEKYINPFTDFGFKKLFGSEFNKELLIDFLNQVLGEREHIKKLSYLNTEVQGRSLVDRRAVFDLFCENERGEKFIIELQNVRQKFFKDRSIYYSALLLQNQAPKGGGLGLQIKSRVHNWDTEFQLSGSSGCALHAGNPIDGQGDPRNLL